MISTSPAFIVRCFTRDWGNSIATLKAAADYCRRISRGYALNPWANFGDSQAYSEAASILESEAESRTLAIAATNLEPWQ